MPAGMFDGMPEGMDFAQVPGAAGDPSQMSPDDRLRDAFAQMLMQNQQQGAGPNAAQGQQPLPMEGLWQQQARQQMPTTFFKPPPITSVEPGPNKGMALPMPQVMDNPGNNQDFPMPPAYTPSSPKPVPAAPSGQDMMGMFPSAQQLQLGPSGPSAYTLPRSGPYAPTRGRR